MTALEQQLLAALERLEAQYADREQAMEEELTDLRALVERLTRQVSVLSAQVETLSAQLAPFVALLPPA